MVRRFPGAYRMRWAFVLTTASVALLPLASQEAGVDTAAAGMVVCAEREAAEEVEAILRDPDAEVSARRLIQMLSSECRVLEDGDSYELVETETTGIVKIRLHGFATAYLTSLTLAPAGK